MTTYREEWSKLAFNRVSAEATRSILKHIEAQGAEEVEPMFVQSRIEDAMMISASLMIGIGIGHYLEEQKAGS